MSQYSRVAAAVHTALVRYLSATRPGDHVATADELTPIVMDALHDMLVPNLSGSLVHLTDALRDLALIPDPPTEETP